MSNLSLFVPNKDIISMQITPFTTGKSQEIFDIFGKTPDFYNEPGNRVLLKCLEHRDGLYCVIQFKEVIFHLI